MPKVIPTLCSRAATTNRLVSKVPGYEYVGLFWLTLYLSYKCTRSCSYCYTRHQKDIPSEMSDEMFEHLLEFIPKVYIASKVAVMLIIFLGGEPLLRTDRVRRIMDRVNKDGLYCGASLFTNGDLLDTVNWDDVKDVIMWNLNVCDLSLAEIKRRTDIIQKNGNVFRQTIVVTMDDENMEGTRIEDIMRLAIENRHRVRLYRNMYKGLDMEYKKAVIKKFHAAIDVAEEYKAKGYPFSYDFFMGILVPHNWDDFGITTPYGCGRGVLSVRPDGSISPCLRDHTSDFGKTIYTEDPIQAVKCDSYRWTYKRDDIPEDCKKCESRQVCQGGCPNDRLVSYGRFDGKPPFCEVDKEIVPRLMALQRKK